MRLSTLLFNDRSVNSITKQQQKVSNTQLQIATGKRVSTPADDPVAVSRILSLKSSKVKSEQFLANINTGKARLGFEDIAMKNISERLTQVREKAIQANNGSFTASERKSIASELDNILSEMVGVANTKYGRDYIFAGFKTLTQPVLLGADGTYTYQGDEGALFTQIGTASEVQLNDNGKLAFFQIPADDITVTEFTGLNSITTINPGQVMAGSLTSIGTGELLLNNVSIAATTADNVSDSDPTASAIAIAAAINNKTSEHDVVATINPNVLNLGILNNPAALVAGDLTINGAQIIDATGTEAAIIAAINDETATTGIVATQPGGSGTAVILTAEDGRNIHLETTAGGTTTNFNNFNMSSAMALDTVTRSTVTLSDHKSFSIGGSTPGNIGLAASLINNAATANTGSGVISSPRIVSVPPETATKNDVYLIRFNANNPNPNFSIFEEANPNTPLTDLDAVEYTAGDKITFNGIEVVITGTPNPDDTFTVQLEPVGTQDIFKTLQNLSHTLKKTSPNGEENAKYSYEIGVAIENIILAQEQISQLHAEIGARLNFMDNQEEGNEQFILFAAQGISVIEDLDFVSAITELTKQSFALEAAQSSFVRIQGLSLFNYL